MAKMNQGLAVSLLIPRSIDDLATGEKILDLWESRLPSLLPERCGNWEPLRGVFDIEDKVRMLKSWSSPFIARRRKPYLYSLISMGLMKLEFHASWKITSKKGEVDVEEFRAFVEVASAELDVDHSCINLLSEQEIVSGRQNGTILALNSKATDFTFVIASVDLQLNLPDVYWLTVYGPPYIEIFGRDQLLAAPVYRVTELRTGHIMVQLTEDINDMIVDPEHFAFVRRRFKDHVGQDAFFSVDHTGPYRTPTFIRRQALGV